MLYSVRRRLSRTWLAACVALGVAALALITVLVFAPRGVIRLGHGDPPNPERDVMPPKQQPVTQDDGSAGDVGPPRSDAVPTERIASAEPPVLKAEEVIAAFNCARETLRLAPYQRDTQLDREAEALLQRFLRDGDEYLDPGYNGYTLTGQLLLDSAYQPERPNGCEIGGFDVTQVQDLAASQTIGVALAPVANAYNRPLYQAIIIGR